MSLSVTLAVPLSTACNCSDRFVFNGPVFAVKSVLLLTFLDAEGCDPNDADRVLHRSSEPLRMNDYFSGVVKY